MYLRITGFFPEPNEDDSLQYKKVVQKELEPSVLEIMGWSSLDEGLVGEWELTPNQARLVARLLEEPAIEGLALFIGCH
ncbi:pyocin S6 family toxin immunity protein [Pseudomonas chlororaphis subsp. aurantiaca]|nr:pyocin S6 family toxin immunity protein [Pseudomonas chlororaphis]WMI97662.1 pyocin S6 family toxin immunity protein [Pseudomonas chlororaphis subsp. aurantiaca]